MTALAAPLAAHPARRSSLRRSLGRSLAWHPEWWVYAVSGVAWVALMLWSLPPLGHWLLMVPAMMLPVVAHHVRTVGLRSIWSRRHRSTVAFVLGYLLAWSLAGALLVAALVGLGVGHHGSHLLPVALLLAAAWQVSVPRRRVVRRCAPLRLGAPSGLAADRDCFAAGVRSAGRCMVESWPVMLAMALSHSLLLMAGLTVVLLSERARGANPQRRGGRPLEAWVLAGFAAVSLVVFV